MLILPYHATMRKVSPRWLSVTLTAAQVNKALATMCSSPVYAIIGNRAVLNSHGIHEKKFFEDASSELLC